MATYNTNSGDGRPWAPSPRKQNRENAKNILCRNVTIYGFCKHEKDGCMYNHDPTKASANNSPQVDRKRLNVDSPSFTPTVPDTSSAKAKPFSPNAISALPFTPKLGQATDVSSTVTGPKSGTGTPSVANTNNSSDWSAQEIPEFVPQSFEQANIFDQNVQGDFQQASSSVDSFNPYNASNFAHSGGGYMPADQKHFSGLDMGSGQGINPYAHDHTAAGVGGPSYFPQQDTFAQPLQYHLYAPMGPHRENLLAYQRTAHDFFIPENLRQELQRKAETTHQTLPNSTLPAAIEHFHSLVPLDNTNTKNNKVFGYNSWLYKAVSSNDGYAYVLRRLEGYRLTNEKAVRSIQAWKRVSNANVVGVYDCFTTRAFGDSSIMFVGDYHPLSKTLVEQHPAQLAPYQRAKSPATLIPEHVLWGYIVQIGSALKAIHGNGLAARLIIPSKIIVTSKNRIRLNACGIIDVVQPAEQTPLTTLQQEDFRQLGRVILALASHGTNNTGNARSVDNISRAYSMRLKECVKILLDAQTPNTQAPLEINDFLSHIMDQSMSLFDSVLHLEDNLNSELSRELENGRLFRLMAKLGCINERPEFNENTPIGAQWSETGERYYLKLFRDYVFHQVDAEGKPVVNLGHMITCLNKLDAGSEEKIALVSRDEQNVFVVSYKEVKRGIESAFQDLLKAGRKM